MSEVKVNKISPRSGTDVTLGDSGDTFTVPTGVTLDTSNSTVTLPDGTVTNAKVNASAAIDYSKLNLTGNIALADLSATGTKDATTFLRGDNTFGVPPLGGITEADQWRINANHSGVATITANWERNDNAGFGYLGTGMTESSGVFTFPSTGIWMIMIQAMVAGNGAAADYASVHFQTTQNNGSSYTNQVCQIVNQIARTGGYANGFGVSFFDVTNTSTHKCRFGQDAQSTTCQLWGDTNIQSTGFTFIRLGDT